MALTSSTLIRFPLILGRAKLAAAVVPKPHLLPKPATPFIPSLAAAVNPRRSLITAAVSAPTTYSIVEADADDELVGDDLIIAEEEEEVEVEEEIITLEPANGGGFKMRDLDHALLVNLDLPGFGKDDVRVLADPKLRAISIRGEAGEKEWDDGDVGEADDDVTEEDEGLNKKGRRVFKGRLELGDDDVYRFEEMRARMKDGILKLAIPKVREEDRDGVITVGVE